MGSDTLFEKALEVGRPPNVRELFPHSRGLLVSGKVVNRALAKKGQAMTMAANGRNYFVIQGALLAAQRANAALIVEIAKSESNYCPVNFWNIARLVDGACNYLGIKRLGRSDADFRPCVRIEARVGHAGDRAAVDVGDRQNLGSARLGLFE